jgi:CubicO group peptidase (beta-lactamase class C family)
MKTIFLTLILFISTMAATLAQVRPQVQSTLRLPEGITQRQAEAHEMKPANIRGVEILQGDDLGTAVNRPIFRKPQTPTGTRMDASAFSNLIHERLKDRTTGYVMQVRRNGQPLQTLIWEWSRTNTDGGKGWTLDTRMHVASVSKMITGIAMYKTLLENGGVAINSKIIDYLPEHWVKGPNIDKITFFDLLNHTSGLSSGNSDSDFATMKSLIEQGTTRHGRYEYANANFGLCRILIPIVNGTVAKNNNFQVPFSDNIWDMITIRAYQRYVQDKIFTLAGVANAGFAPSGNNGALAYRFPHGNRKGWDSGDLSTMSGGAGWRLSVNEVLQVMDAFRRKGSIMSVERAQYVLNNRLGLDRALDTPAGKYYDKNGRWTTSEGTEQCVAVFLPNNMEVVVFVNSPIGSGMSLRGVVYDAFISSLENQ